MKILKAIIWIAIAVGLVFGAIKAVKKKKEEEAKIQSAKVYKISVKTLTLKKSKVLLTLPYLATVESSNDANIVTKVAARVVKMAKIGDRVKKGDIVVKLDDSDLKEKVSALKLSNNSIKINIDAKKITLKNLLLTHKRTKELLDVKGASIEEYQNEEDRISLTKASIKTLQSSIQINNAKIKELQNLISYTVLRSPTDGIVDKTFISKSEVAMAGKPLMSISSFFGKYLKINLPPSKRVKEIIYNGKKYPAISLNSTFNGLDSYKVDIKSDLRAGQRVNIKVIVFDAEAVKVPLNGVLQDNGQNYIFIVQGDGAVQKKVNILASGEEGFAISSEFDGKKIVLAKPDIFLKLVSGLKIKEQ